MNERDEILVEEYDEVVEEPVISEGFGAKLIYLGIYDSPDNYKEIDEAEYVEPEIPGQES